MLSLPNNGDAAKYTSGVASSSISCCRQTRTIPTQIKELKAELPKPDAEGNRPSSPLDQEISELEQVHLMSRFPKKPPASRGFSAF